MRKNLDALLNAPENAGVRAALAAPAAPTPQGMDAIPEYFAKPGIVENLAAAHPVMLVRQMANEILRQRSASTDIHTKAIYDLLRDWLNDGDGGLNDVTIHVGRGHGGPGLYVSLTEYPEEGAALLVEAPQNESRSAAAKPSAGTGS